MMIKKHLLHVLALSVAVLSLQSCITDDSTSPSGNVSKLSLSQDLQQKYTLDRWDTLKIAPKVVQTNAQKDVAYEWEINRKVVSTDAQLKYVCEEFGVFPCRLKVTNGDNIQFYEFELNVQYSYVEGLYILASHGGRAIVSYLPEPQSNKSFDLNVLQKNNPNANFTSAPKDIDYALARDNKTPLIYVAVGNPSAIYELDGNLMTTRFKTTATGNVSYLKRSALTYPKSMLAMVDHVPARLTLSETSLFDLGKFIKDSLKTDMSMADAAVSWKQQDLRYVHGYVLFDNAEGRLVPQKVQATGKIPAQLLKGTFTGDPPTAACVPGGFAEQPRQSLMNLKAVLEAGGSSLDKVLKTTVFLSDMNNFAEMNKVYSEVFGTGNYPGRSAVQVARLPKDGLVEIEAIALA